METCQSSSPSLPNTASLPVSLGTIHIEFLPKSAPHHLRLDAAHTVHDGISALIDEVKHLNAENAASENDHLHIIASAKQQKDMT